MHEPPKLGGRFGVDLIGDNNVILIDLVKGLLSTRNIFGINLIKFKDSGTVIGFGLENESKAVLLNPAPAPAPNLKALL